MRSFRDDHSSPILVVHFRSLQRLSEHRPGNQNVNSELDVKGSTDTTVLGESDESEAKISMNWMD